MAILRGFPPSNPISPTIHIGPKDLVSSVNVSLLPVVFPPDKTMFDKNYWLKRRNMRSGAGFMVTSRVIMPERVPDKSKMPRFMSSGV